MSQESHVMGLCRRAVLGVVLAGFMAGCGGKTKTSAPTATVGTVTVPTVKDEKAVRLPMPPAPPPK